MSLILQLFKSVLGHTSVCKGLNKAVSSNIYGSSHGRKKSFDSLLEDVIGCWNILCTGKIASA